MKISYKLDYALKTIFELALNYQNKIANIQELSEKLDIPKKFLEQILLELKKNGFVDSKRGKIGGYFLAKKPDQIILGNIIRVIDGSIEPIECIENNYNGCKDINKCIFRSIWQDVNLTILKIVDNITIEDLIVKFRQQNQISDYII